MVSHGTITSCVIVDAHAEDMALYFAEGALRTLIANSIRVLPILSNSCEKNELEYWLD